MVFNISSKFSFILRHVPFYTTKAFVNLFSISSVTSAVSIEWSCYFHESLQKPSDSQLPIHLSPLKLFICVCKALDSCGFINDVALELTRDQDKRTNVKISWNQKPTLENRVDNVIGKTTKQQNEADLGSTLNKLKYLLNHTLEIRHDNTHWKSTLTAWPLF